MTDKEKKEKFLESYKNNVGVLSDSLNESGVSAKDYNKFLEEPRFKEEIEAVQLIQDDLVTSSFLRLVQNGDPRAIIEARKMQKERSSGLDVQEIKRKAMIYFTNKAETKCEILTEFCDWFNLAESTAESYYKKVKVEHRLKSPHERKKQKDKDEEQRLDVRIKSGKISEIEIIEVLMIKQAEIVEDAVHPSERSTASSNIIIFTKRIADMKAEALRASTLSNERLCDVLDSELMGISIDKVKELTKQFNPQLLEVSDAL